jgi:hypothetical protein
VTGPVVLDGLDAVRASAGTELGPTGWVEVTDERLAAWEAACPGSPVGWLLLSLTNLFMPEMVVVTGVSAGLNVGTGEVRFAEGLDVAVGSRVRATGHIAAADEARGGVQTTIRITVASESGAALVEVDALSRWLE